MHVRKQIGFVAEMPPTRHWAVEGRLYEPRDLLIPHGRLEEDGKVDRCLSADVNLTIAIDVHTGLLVGG